ncbi:MAG: glycosyltransferase [Burkholderiales bacterium]|nr:glycosyltransferase [Burkholderiales bacterium]
MKYSIDRLVVRGRRVFGFGWLFHPEYPVSAVRLELTLSDGGTVSIPVEFGRTRDDVADAFPGVATALRAGFFLYGGWSGGAATSAALVGTAGDGSGFRLAAPMSDMAAPGDRPALVPDKRMLAARAWAMLRRGQWRELLRKAGRHARVQAGPRPYTPAALRRLLGSRQALLVIDHDLGGGANMYRERVLAGHLAAGGSAVLFTYQVQTLEHVLEIRSRRGTTRFVVPGPDEVAALAAQGLFERVLFNNAVSFERPEAIAALLVELRQGHGIPLTVVVHDYHMVCPSQFLLDHRARYCGVPEEAVCRGCLARNDEGFVSLFEARDIGAWRGAWGKCLAVAESIRCFSDASRELLLRAYPHLERGRIAVDPHRVDHLPLRRPALRPGAVLHVGVVGHVDRAKGAGVVRELALEIRARGLPVRVSVIGTVAGDLPGEVVSATGAYDHAQLPRLIEESGANVFLFPSIVPETFSFVTQELIECDVPLVCFDLGAQAERVRKYNRGLVVPVGSADLLDRLLRFHADLQDGAPVAGRAST